jgi:hypothetical protein
LSETIEVGDYVSFDSPFTKLFTLPLTLGRVVYIYKDNVVIVNEQLEQISPIGHYMIIKKKYELKIVNRGNQQKTS